MYASGSACGARFGFPDRHKRSRKRLRRKIANCLFALAYRVYSVDALHLDTSRRDSAQSWRTKESPLRATRSVTSVSIKRVRHPWSFLRASHATPVPLYHVGGVFLSLSPRCPPRPGESREYARSRPGPCRGPEQRTGINNPGFPAGVPIIRFRGPPILAQKLR